MRILLFTGKGGVGKTTIAAATALRAAQAGHRTLITSTDPAHSLADSFDIALGDEVSEIRKNLWAEQIDAQSRLESNWRDIQEYIISFLNWAGIDAIEAEELSVIPGLDEIFSLTDVKRHVESGLFDLLVIDCAPTAETLRLLSLPEVMNWYIERIFPVERKVVKTIRPILTRITTMPIAEDRIFAAVERLHRNLEGVGKLLRDEERASVRLVVNPEKMVIAEARRTYTYLSLFGYRVDAIVANRIIPGDVTDPYFGKWKEIQNEHLATIRESFQPVPVLTARLFEQEMVGFDLLKRMGDDVYEDTDETKVFHLDEPIRVQKRGPWYVLSVQLPFTDRTQLDIHRKAEELVVRVGSYKRTLILPHALQRLEIREARFVEDRLEIRFREKGGTGRAPARKAANPSGEERGRKHG
ncbi:MAG TPA: TRC40/GET3/ArsA family transport-energizing ATPase [Actinomycetota bacterium]|jgi:arsenite/tail-anchored protein-transporting ATPase|nr:TRC40/GET3/ArsA family transport-energizing ATPase [Actinomycetota bacterium]